MLKENAHLWGVTCLVHDTCTDREGSNLCGLPPGAQLPANTDSTPETPIGWIVKPDEDSLQQWSDCENTLTCPVGYTAVTPSVFKGVTKKTIGGTTCIGYENEN